MNQAPRDTPELRARQTLAKAEELRLDGKLVEAGALITPLIHAYPDYYAAYHTLGLIYADQGRLDEAILNLSKADALLPGQSRTLVALSSTYLEMGSQSSARRFVEEALAHDPNQAAAHLMIANIAKDERDYEVALAATERALNLEPNWTEAQLARAVVLSQIGHHVAAAAELEAVLARDPGNVPALALHISLPKNSGVQNLAEGIRAAGLLSAPTELDQIAQQFFAANVYKRLGQAEAAWRYFEAGNSRMSEQLGPDVTRLSTWQQDSLHTLHGRGQPGFPDDPDQSTSLFILGASRSGKTTIEAVLSGSAQIKNGYESLHLKEALTQTFAASGFVPTVQLDLLPEVLTDGFCERYFAALGPRMGGRAIYSNTSPLQIHNAWSLADRLPNARFIFITRDPIDTAIRIFQTHYSSANQYAYDPQTALDHVTWYAAMIDACTARFGDRAVKISYEDFTRQPAQGVAKIQAMLGLDLDLPTPQPLPNDTQETQIYRHLFEQMLK